jgi:predicted molibdopterin-dependent oxidoreductase YjgC
MKVMEAARRGARLIVIDPRRTEVAALAEGQKDGLFLRLKPGTNIPLLNSILYVIFEEGLENTAFIDERTENIEAVRDHVAEYPPEKTEEITGVPAGLVREVARAYASAENALILYGLGVAEHKGGTAGVMALANLVLATGHVGRPFNGINPLRGQNNVQGACDMGTLPYSYPGYFPADDPDALASFASVWGVRELPCNDGLLEPQMYDAALSGRLKAMYIAGYDPAHTQANVGHVQKALSRLDFVVLQDLFLTETARFAHVFLPAACFYEKGGTFTSGERRVRRIHKAVEPFGGSKADWEIVSLIARAMGHPFVYSHPREIMEEIARVVPQYAGISYDRLDGDGQVWPCPAPGHPGTPLLHVTGFPRGKGHFVPVSYILPEEDADRDYPLVLITGRRLVHYNNGSMTRRSEGFDVISDSEAVEISPEDARRFGVKDGMDVYVASRRGRVRVRALVTERIRQGAVFMSFHFQDALVNLLTSPGLDLKTLTPEYKVCAVKIEPAG